MSASHSSKKVILIALFANLGIAIAKFAGAMVSKSGALLAEAIHSAVDSSNQALLLLGNKLSQKPPSSQHPLGYGRETFFWSFIVAILLFSLGGLFAIYEGIHKLSSDQAIKSPWLGIGILILAIGLEGYALHACLKEIKLRNRFGSLWQWFKKSTASELIVIFTEDTAALLGLIIALISLLTAWLTGNPFWDAFGTIAIGVVLVIMAGLLAIEIKSLIIGEASTLDFESFIQKQMAEQIPGGKILNIIALQIGGDQVLLSCKFSPGTGQDVKALLKAVNKIERAVEAKFPQVKWQFMELDVAD